MTHVSWKKVRQTATSAIHPENIHVTPRSLWVLKNVLVFFSLQHCTACVRQSNGSIVYITHIPSRRMIYFFIGQKCFSFFSMQHCACMRQSHRSLNVMRANASSAQSTGSGPFCGPYVVRVRVLPTQSREFSHYAQCDLLHLPVARWVHPPAAVVLGRVPPDAQSVRVAV